MKKLITRRGVLVGAAASAAVSPTNLKSANANLPRTHEVRITQFKFEPDVVVVGVGEIIRWSNFDLAPHTATGNALGWNTGEIAKGMSKELVVTNDMETRYFCAFHPHMKGAIKIKL
ncbi:hypothetical protein GO984_23065 [Rhodobacteraceae bacterium CY05]|uniref:Plastocyanin n=1 Tax=Parasedimentitalea huanghaiensis TaxID=2682100 RepID=A0A6L6WLZ6_9RHOB|nr:hypothetical protein [Zongyanglinia huanghaiensis]